MSNVNIDNPVINSPFEEPKRHFKFNARGITEEIADGRRRSEYFMPFPKPKKQSGAAQAAQLQFELPDQDLREANTFINNVRTRVAAWRNSGYPGVTPTTRRLLEHWNNPENEPRLYFCQREAVETAIYLNEYENRQRNDAFYQELVQANEEARLWINGIEAVKAKIGVKQVYDLSATPFFLGGSGYSMTTPSGKKLNEGVLFPWVVSDFALIDAIESGIAKVPRVPVADDMMKGDPIYRRLWDIVGPKLRRITLDGEPQLPQELETALQSLYGNYEKSYDLWQREPHGLTPPVMIVVCNNTKVSKLVYDWIAGWQKKNIDGENVVVKGNLPIFNNEHNGAWSEHLNTLLIDSNQLESGEALKGAFKKAAHTQIEQFKREMNTDKVTDADLLREAMNTVGKKGKLGEQIKCVVSVSMLSEGWDAKRVTHILGVRAFSTQLLCEQVVGRGLRRSSHDVEKTTIDVNGEEVKLETFPPEYAEVYGVPFSFIPATGSGKTIPPLPVTEVEALPERKAKCEITFPIVAGYRRQLPPNQLDAIFTEESRYELSTAEIPVKVEIEAITGGTREVDLPYMERFRRQQTEYYLAKTVMNNYFLDDDDDAKWWLFPQVLRITRRWMKECVTYKDNMYPQYFQIGEIGRKAAFRIYQGILRAEQHNENSNSAEDNAPKVFLPFFRDKSRTGSTEDVEFETTQPTWETRPDKCHISHVVADTESWEQKTAQALEQMDEVVAYVKNHNLGFTIPYVNHNGANRQYVPDFIARIRKRGDDSDNNIVNLILETSGRGREDKVQKVNTVNNMWVPAVNNSGEFGEWTFLEITDPWDMQNTIREFMNEYAS